MAVLFQSVIRRGHSIAFPIVVSGPESTHIVEGRIEREDQRA
jgi:hypothetical protein